jgi:hypothetical protein
MTRRLLALALTAGLALIVVPAQAAPITCKLSGTAHFTPGVKTSAQSISYTFAGSLANCMGGPKSGTVSAVGAGSFSCATGTSSGTATINWVTGQTSGVAFTTNQTTALVRIGGTVASGLNAGSKVTGAIVFVANAALCATSGLPSANFNGAVRA